MLPPSKNRCFVLGILPIWNYDNMALMPLMFPLACLFSLVLICFESWLFILPGLIRLSSGILINRTKWRAPFNEILLRKMRTIDRKTPVQVILKCFEKRLCTSGPQVENILLFCPAKYRTSWAEKLAHSSNRAEFVLNCWSDYQEYNFV